MLIGLFAIALNSRPPVRPIATATPTAARMTTMISVPRHELPRLAPARSPRTIVTEEADQAAGCGGGALAGRCDFLGRSIAVPQKAQVP
jgi:hypothetical protein